MNGNLAQPAAALSRFRRAGEIVRAHGRSALDALKLYPDKSFFFSPDKSAFLAYREALGTTVVLGDPVGPPASLAPFLRSFLEKFERRGGSVVFLQVGEEFLPHYRAQGLSPVRIGATAIVDLARFDLHAPGAKPLRYARRRLAKEGLAVKHIEPPLGEGLVERLRVTNASWLRLPGRFERGFSAGRFNRSALRDSPVSLIERADGRIVAFANWIPSFAAGEATVDLIRRRCDAPACALDALMTTLLARARARRYSRFNLGLAPLARIGDGPPCHPAERVERWIFRHGRGLNGQAGLYAWKSKFRPAWETRWLVYRGGPLAFARIAWAIRRVVRASTPPLAENGRRLATIPYTRRLQMPGPGPKMV